MFGSAGWRAGAFGGGAGWEVAAVFALRSVLFCSTFLFFFFLPLLFFQALGFRVVRLALGSVLVRCDCRL